MGKYLLKNAANLHGKHCKRQKPSDKLDLKMIGTVKCQNTIFAGSFQFFLFFSCSQTCLDICLHNLNYAAIEGAQNSKK